MKRLIPLTGALVLALGVSQAALAQNGNGNGNGNGKDNGGGKDRGQQGRDDDRGRGSENRGSDDRGNRGGDRDDRRDEVRDVVRDVTRGADYRGSGDRRDVERVLEREVVGQVSGDGRVVYLRRARDRGLLTGCPPGLAKKDNGCLPPGQARKIERARDDYGRYDYLWRSREDDDDYRYRDGYVYRMNPQGSLLGYLPVLGGALSAGNAWPGQYAYQPVPQYYADYFGLNDRSSYRYADGVMYGLDPRTQQISQVAALLTGQEWNVGQRMPDGYDVYNVPYAYRDQYVDSAERAYRYDDGRVYQVDPTTQLVQAVIQLLT